MIYLALGPSTSIAPQPLLTGEREACEQGGVLSTQLGFLIHIKFAECRGQAPYLGCSPGRPLGLYLGAELHQGLVPFVPHLGAELDQGLVPFLPHLGAELDQGLVPFQPHLGAELNQGGLVPFLPHLGAKLNQGLVPFLPHLGAELDHGRQPLLQPGCLNTAEGCISACDGIYDSGDSLYALQGHTAST